MTFDRNAAARRAWGSQLRKRRRAQAQDDCNRVIDNGQSVERLDELLEALLKLPVDRNRRPQCRLDQALSFQAYSGQARNNVDHATARENAMTFTFPPGTLVTRPKGMTTVRLELGDKSVSLERKRVAVNGKRVSRWYVLSHTGFRVSSGRRAGSRSSGRGPDSSEE